MPSIRDRSSGVSSSNSIPIPGGPDSTSVETRTTRPIAEAEYELYDYQADPLETKNLAKEKPMVLAKLKKILRGYPQPVPRKRSGSKRKAKQK